MSTEIITFALPQPDVSEGTMTARLVPFGESVEYGGRAIHFDSNSLDVAEGIPLNLDHGSSVLDVIGRSTAITWTDGAMFGAFEFADTSAAQDARTLAADGLVTDVSIGVADFSIDDDGRMSGRLDHVALVQRGRFGEAEAPSKVLSVHSVEEPPMAEDQATEVAETPDTDQIQLSALEQKIAAFGAQLAEVAEAAAPTDTTAVFDGITASHLEDAIRGAVETRADFALADVVGDLGSNDASGLNPDFYWAEGLQQEARVFRPLFTNAGTGPFPSYGLNLTSAKVTQDVAVAARTAQKAEAASQALHVDPITFPVVFFAGAVEVALELISQSSPNVLGVLRRSMLKQYAAATEADIVAKALAGATATGAALRTDTYANFITDIMTGAETVRVATGMPGNYVAVTSAEWIAINALVDGDGRRQFAPIGPMNADGTSTLLSEGMNIAGINVFKTPAAANAFQFNQDSLVKHEKAAETIQVTNVSNIGLDIAIWGGTVISFWNEGLLKYTA